MENNYSNNNNMVVSLSEKSKYIIILIYCCSNQVKNFSRLTDSITIGIELCNIPQISEHCP